MRIPLGILTDRHGGRKVFTALMAFTPLPLDRPRALQRLVGRRAHLRLPARVRRCLVRGRRPVREQVVPGGAPGLRARHLRHRAWAAPCSARSPRRRSSTRRASTSRSGSRRSLVAVMAVVFWTLAEDAPGSASGTRQGSWLAPLCGLPRARGSARAWALTLFYFMAFGGFVAMFLFLPKLLTGVHDLSQARRRLPRRRLRRAGRGRPSARRLAVGPHRCRDGADRSRSRERSSLALVLAGTYKHMVPLTIACLTMAICLGLGTGAVFKLVPAVVPRQGRRGDRASSERPAGSAGSSRRS